MADKEHGESPEYEGSEGRQSASPAKTSERDFEYIRHSNEGELGHPAMVSSQINTDEFDPLAVKRQEQHPEHSSVDDFFSQDSIQAGVDTVHSDIDSVLNRISPVPVASEHQPVHNLFLDDAYRPREEQRPAASNIEARQHVDAPILDFSSGDSGDQRPFYGVHVRDDDPEETFERSGPLTIPSDVLSKNLEDALAESIVSNSIAEAAEKSAVKSGEPETKFETVPRPPTPPKDISDEDQQPSSLDLGPPPPTHSQSASDEHPRSILKNAAAGPWLNCGSLNPTVEELIYWRDPKKSAVALSLTLLTLLLFAKTSLISLVSYVGLLVLGGTVGYRLVARAQSRLKKTNDVNPFEPLLSAKITVPTEKIHSQADVIAHKLSQLATHLRHLLLVEDLSDSLKFGLILWALSIVGRWFSGLCFCFVIVIGIFTIPKFYDVYKGPIDEQLRVAEEHIKKAHEAMAEKLPFLKQKTN